MFFFLSFFIVAKINNLGSQKSHSAGWIFYGHVFTDINNENTLPCLSSFQQKYFCSLNIAYLQQLPNNFTVNLNTQIYASVNSLLPKSSQLNLQQLPARPLKQICDPPTNYNIKMDALLVHSARKFMLFRESYRR